MPLVNSTYRVAALRTRYLQIAARTYIDFMMDEAEYKGLRKKYPIHSEMIAKEGDTARQLQNRVIDQAIQIIVFVGMHLEATIYDYAAQHLGDTKAKEIDKEDVPTKYLLVPKEVTGEAMLKGGIAYNALKTTVRARNDLVHWKSIGVNANDVDAILKQLAEIDGMVQKILNDAHTAMEAAIFLGFEMQRLMRRRNEQAARDAVNSGDPRDVEQESYRDRRGDGTMFPDLTIKGTFAALDLPEELHKLALAHKRKYDKSIANLK